MLPSAADIAQGFNTSQEKPARQQSASSYLHSWPQQVTPAAAQPCSAPSGRRRGRASFFKRGEKTSPFVSQAATTRGSAAGEGSDTRPPPSAVTPAPGQPHPGASGKTALQHSPGSNAALQTSDLASFLSGKPGCCPRIPPSSAACNPWVGSL